jgi:hypothetical protein
MKIMVNKVSAARNHSEKRMAPLKLIKFLGFRCVGKWHTKENVLDFDIEPAVRNKKWSLYAFVVGSKVLYIGKSTGPFIRRMSGYRRPGKSQPTNSRISPKILEMLQSKKKVSIYHFESKELDFMGIPLNLAAALEDTLIARVSLEWNINGTTKKRSD